MFAYLTGAYAGTFEVEVRILAIWSFFVLLVALPATYIPRYPDSSFECPFYFILFYVGRREGGCWELRVKKSLPFFVSTWRFLAVDLSFDLKCICVQ